MTAELNDQPFSADIVSSETVFEGAVWNVRRDVLRYNDTEIAREYVDHTGAVGVLAIDGDGRVLMIRQYRHPVRHRDWEIPAGLLDIENESPLEAARRELSEEADLEADRWNVLADIFSSPGGNDEVVRIYLARGVRSTGSTFEREAEEADIEVAWVPLDEAVDAALSRRLHNAPLLVALLAAREARERDWSTLGAGDEPWPGQLKLSR